MTETATLGWGRLRRFLFHYVLFLMIVPQALFVLHGMVGLDFDPRYMVWLVPAVLPVTLAAFCTFTEDKRKALEEPAAWTQWAFVGALMFGVWAGSYFITGRLIDPTRVRYLSAEIESHVPFVPAWSLAYILLYPIFLLPFFAIRDRAVLQRLVVAYLLMFGICSTMFVAIPVAFDRPPLPPAPHDFGTWVMSLVHGSDPPWNCLPSEHCAAAMLAALFLWETDKRLGGYALATALLIGVSTLFTKQHYVVDVLAGYGISVGIHFALRWAKNAVPSTTAAGG